MDVQTRKSDKLVLALGRVEITRTGRCNAAKCFGKFC